jgi:hypothetical protein
MIPVPVEFDPVHIAANASTDLHMYRNELASKDPMHSVLEENPEIYFVPPKRSSEWGQWEFRPGSYYDTTLGAKHPFWKGKDLPIETMDIKRLRSDMLNWDTAKLTTPCQRNK